MIAIYARQSVEKPDSISVESQVEFCLCETMGKPYQVYTDRGYSGKNTDRPGLGQLLEDIKQGGIEKVVVYKLDRISRSILDFSRLVEIFERCGVEFVSMREKFDTATPIGRAMLNICVVFAQLERETIQNRIADAYASRSKKGLFMGGRVPYGYRREPAVIGGVRTSIFVACPEESRHIRLMYQLYGEQRYSYGAIADYFAKQGILKNGRPWVRERIAEMLKNPVYVRADPSIHDYFFQKGVAVLSARSEFSGINGCYYYRNSAGGAYLLLAPHAGIIDAPLWLDCQKRRRSAAPAHKAGLAKNTWLASKVKCGLCGYAMVAKSIKDRHTRYFICSGRANAKNCQGPGTQHADQIESVVLQALKEKISTLTCPTQNTDPHLAKELARLEQKIAAVDKEIATYIEQIPLFSDAAAYINEKIASLDCEKRTAENALLKLRSKSDELSLRPFSDRLDCLPFEEKKQVLSILVKKIEIWHDKITVHWQL